MTVSRKRREFSWIQCAKDNDVSLRVVVQKSGSVVVQAVSDDEQIYLRIPCVLDQEGSEQLILDLEDANAIARKNRKAK